jgi:outer membrane receptor protein involved in Fe transport
MAASSTMATGAIAQVAALSLEEALKQAARRSGREIIYPADAVSRRPAGNLDPGVTPEDAVRALLRGTDLEAEFRPDVIIVRRQRPLVPGAVEGAPAEERTVVVTATRIRGEQASSPVVVTERRAIELAGLADLGEFARRLPQNFGGGQNPGVAGGGTQGGNINTTGSSNVNLRGLGEDATLTLINGHRVAYDGVSQGIDISTIPIAAISRVEVVADGGSALHGSDAVGGVVNVILRPDFDGLLTTARVGVSLDRGFEQEQLSAVTGARWTSGGMMVAADLSRNGSIDARDRDYTAALDATATLFPSRRQVGAVANAHQRVGIATLAMDAEYSNRESRYATAFLTSGAATTDGLLNHPTVDFHAFSPSVRLDLPGEWTASLTGTHSRSLALLRNRAFSRSVETALRLRYDNRLLAGELGAEGPLLHLPGGDARLAVGAGARSLDLRVRNTSTTAGVTRTTADYGGERDVLFGYGELSLPIVGAGNRRPFLEELRFDAAARYEHYRGVADIVTPKVGVIYSPAAGVTLKATWGRSFKAPTLFQEKQVRQSALAPGALFAGTPVGRTVLLLSGGGNQLRAERAESWSGTMELRPSSSLTLSASYFDVRYRDRVTTPINSAANALSDPRFGTFIVYNPTPAALEAVIATLPQGLSNRTGRPYDPASVYAIINNGLTNLAQQHARAVDVSLEYKVELEGGQRVGVTASASYLESDQQVLPGQAPIQRAGTIFDPPHWRGRLATTWERRGVTVAGFANYSGENLDDRAPPFGAVGSFFTFDTSVRAKAPGARGMLAGLEAGITILNVFGEKPSGIPNLNRADPPYDTTNSSVLGRTIAMTLSKAW